MIFAFGDSITQGYWDDEKGGWCNRLSVYEMEKTLKSDFVEYCPVFNLGIDGERSCDLVKRFSSELEARREEGKGDLTLIAIGVNDSAYNRGKETNWCDINEFESNIRSVISISKKYGKVFLIGIAPVNEKVLDPMPWFPEYSYLDTEIKKYNNVLKKISKDENISYVSMDGVFGENVATKTVDGIHPNADGHQLMFERIKEALNL
jgi:lysophospholipase L1-like esterase